MQQFASQPTNVATHRHKTPEGLNIEKIKANAVAVQAGEHDP
jgi:hypothetical protein